MVVGLQLSEADQELYKNFPLVVSERWQQEVSETVFETINLDTDKIEQKKKNKPRIDELEENCRFCLLLIFPQNCGWHTVVLL